MRKYVRNGTVPPEEGVLSSALQAGVYCTPGADGRLVLALRFTRWRKKQGNALSVDRGNLSGAGRTGQEGRRAEVFSNREQSRSLRTGYCRAGRVNHPE